MSRAAKCDRCDTLFEPEHRCVSLDVHVTSAKDPDTSTSWSDVDLCPKCSSILLGMLGPALSGVEEA